MLASAEVVAACARLGLARTVGAGRFAEGVVDGVRTAVIDLAAGRGDDDLTLVAWLPRPTDLGWSVSQAGLLAFAAQPPLDTGAADFDALVASFASPDVADHARELLGPEVRELLLRMVRVGRPFVSDTAVGLVVSSFGATGEELVQRVGWCVEAARRIAAGAQGLPPHPALAAGGHAEALRRMAVESGMSLHRNALCVEGATATAALRVTLRATDAAFLSRVDDTLVAAPAGYTVHLRFREPLGAGLALRPASTLDRAKDLLGLGDIRLGDDAFDRAWTISAASPDLARATLNPAARELLGRLASLGLRLTLGDAGVDGQGALPPSPETLPKVVWCLEGLRDALRPRSSGGAYR